MQQFFDNVTVNFRTAVYFRENLRRDIEKPAKKKNLRIRNYFQPGLKVTTYKNTADDAEIS